MQAGPAGEARARSKLAALVEELVRVVTDAEKQAIDAEDERRKWKVLVFSFFEDTVDWIQSYLDGVLETDSRLDDWLPDQWQQRQDQAATPPTSTDADPGPTLPQP